MPAKSVEPASSASRVATTGVALPPSRFLDPWQKPVFLLCLICWVGLLVLSVLRIETSPGERWLEGLFLCFATLSTLLGLARRVPLQNVVATAMLIALISGAVGSLVSVSGIPFGPIFYLGSFGNKFFDVLPWPAPLGWIFLIVNGRGIARLIMRPWRKTNYYGFWVIGYTCLLAVILDVALEPFAVYVKEYWIWQTPKSVPAWYTAPWVNFLGWFITALAILTFSMPWLINKQPVKQPIDYHPLIVWLLLNWWLMAGNGVHHLWPAVAVGLLSNAVATIFAIRGAQW